MPPAYINNGPRRLPWRRRSFDPKDQTSDISEVGYPDNLFIINGTEAVYNHMMVFASSAFLIFLTPKSWSNSG